MDSKLLFNQINIHLPKQQGVTIKTENNKMNFYVDGKLEFYVRASGGISYVPDCVYTDKVKELSDTVINTSKYVRAYLKAIEDSPELNIHGLENDYKLIAQFNNIVLAGKVMSGGEQVDFVTWDKDNTGVSAGHYFGSDFEGAKEDFAVRSELVDKYKIFAKNELVEIYRCVEDTISMGFELSTEQEEALENIKGKITEVIPNILELTLEPREENSEDNTISSMTM